MSLKITPVLCNAGIMDNYAYLLTDEQSGVSAVVDAAEPEAIIAACTEKNIKPQYVFVTHHHEDHTNGNLALKQKYGLKIVGSEVEKRAIPGIDIALKDGDTFTLGNSTAQIILTPGHTNGHILWYFAQEKALFTGDMLFNLCIGGLFEGTPQEMWQSIQKIRNLPDDVRFYPGHEYTQANVNVLLRRKSEPECQTYLSFVEERMRKRQPIVGQTLGLEKKYNPYFQFLSEADFVNYFEG